MKLFGLFCAVSVIVYGIIDIVSCICHPGRSCRENIRLSSGRIYILV